MRIAIAPQQIAVLLGHLLESTGKPFYGGYELPEVVTMLDRHGVSPEAVARIKSRSFAWISRIRFDTNVFDRYGHADNDSGGRTGCSKPSVRSVACGTGDCQGIPKRQAAAPRTALIGASNIANIGTHQFVGWQV